jgi:restriction endonuclease S subunit
MTDLSKEADTLGYSAIIPKPSCGRFLHNQRLGKVLIKNGARLNKGFLYHLLRTNDYRHEVMASAKGTTVKHTSPNRILAFKFKLPPPYEQQAIAHILGTLDDKIELNRYNWRDSDARGLGSHPICEGVGVKFPHATRHREQHFRETSGTDQREKGRPWLIQPV